MSFVILAINPGSTSTKITYYEDEKAVWVKSIEHDRETLSKFSCINDQHEMRKQLILAAMKEENTDMSKLSAVVSRGGLLPPVRAGAYEINQDMIDTLRYNPVNEHASNLGAAIAYEIAQPLGIPAYV